MRKLPRRFGFTLSVVLLLSVGCKRSGAVEGEVFGECKDGIDNDSDGLTDCEDADCITRDRCNGEPDSGMEVDTGPSPDVCEPCVGDRAGWIRVEAGNDLSCGLTQSERIECWGENSSGQRDVPQGIAFSAMAVGGYHVCALDREGVPICWGNDLHGQATPPVGEVFEELSAGQWVSCGRKSSGDIRCWGMDAWGITTPPETSFQQVAVGYDHVCALDDQKKVQCWGNSHEAKTIPPTNSRFERISAGGEHNCGILSSGRVECWGSNLHGQLDAVLGLYDHLDVGSSNSCAITVDGEAVCWGIQEAEGTTEPLSYPGPEGLFSQISAGVNHACAVGEDGRIQCWGDNTFEQANPP